MATNRRSNTLYGTSREDVSDSFKVLTDSAGSGVTYIGTAEPGSATSDSVWQIVRMTETGPDIEVVHADGDDYFDNVWDDRASLVYS